MNTIKALISQKETANQIKQFCDSVMSYLWVRPKVLKQRKDRAKFEINCLNVALEMIAKKEHENENLWDVMCTVANHPKAPKHEKLPLEDDSFDTPLGKLLQLSFRELKDKRELLIQELQSINGAIRMKKYEIEQ